VEALIRADLNWALRLRESSRRLRGSSREILRIMTQLYAEGVLSQGEFIEALRILGTPLARLDDPTRYEVVVDEDAVVEEPVSDDAEVVGDDVEVVREEYVGWRFVRWLSLD
jgi:hypothetical protein